MIVTRYYVSTCINLDTKDVKLIPLSSDIFMLEEDKMDMLAKTAAEVASKDGGEWITVQVINIPEDEEYPRCILGWWEAD